MQKLVVGLLVFISSVAGAQDYKPFTVNVAAGYAMPADKPDNNDISKAGFVYSIEPQYRLPNKLIVGLRLEQAFIQRPEFLDRNINFQTKTKSIISAALTVNYELATGSKIRPYAGLGVGFYYADKSEQFYATSGVPISYPLQTTTVIGGLGRIGVKYGMANLEIDYNLISDTRLTNNATRFTLVAKNSYASAKIGFTIGSRK